MSDITSYFTRVNLSLNRYGPIPLLFFGTIGNFLNLFIFTRKTFRNNICVIYFLASTISDAFMIAAGLLSRVLNGFGYDIAQNSSILCKLRIFTTYYTGYASAWFISFACIERYLSSSTDVQKRQFVTKKHTYISIIFVILFGFIAFGEQFYCMDINQNLLGGPQSCYQLQLNVSCQIADSLMQFFFQILAPAIMMIIFGLLIVRNIRRKRMRTGVGQQTTTQHTAQEEETTARTPAVTVEFNRTIQKRDAQLITMLLIQVKKIIL